MEPWRKRGFVPDSDEEDEFDSLDAKIAAVDDADDVVDLEYIPLPVSTSRTETKGAVNDQQPDTANENRLTTLSDTEEVAGAAEKTTDGRNLILCSPAEKKQSTTPDTQSGTAANESNDHPASPSLGEKTPRPRRARRAYGKRSSSMRTPHSLAKEPQDVSKHQDDSIWDIPSSPVERVRPARKSRSHESTPKPSTPAQESKLQSAARLDTTESQGLIDIPSSRSSSPDEINVVMQPSPKPPLKTTRVETTDVPQQETTDDGSPLSSPPSSLHSPADDPQEGMERISTIPPQDDLDQNLPNLDITLEALAQLSPPTRRSLRERKEHQVRPFSWEFALYQQQMRERGVRPVRLAVDTQRHHAPEPTGENQEQDSFDPSTHRSSPPPEEYLPPVRPERPREQDLAGREVRQHDQQRSPIQRAHSFKRRKRSHSGALHDRRQRSGTHARPQVVINNTPPHGGIDLSIFDLTPSPPHSGSVSSASKTPRVSEGFRFPPGFTPPPTTTTRVDSKSATPRTGEPTGERPTGSIVVSDEEADSDASQSSSADPEEDNDARLNRLMQRRIRGVLPASWVRIDAQEALRQQQASQRNRQAAAHRPDGKGVARKIVRKSGQPRPQQGLIDLGDSDESDGENQHPRTNNPVQEDADHRLARVVGFENPFDRDGEVLEDNRIDCMLPTIPRTSSGFRDKRKSLKRVHSKESAASKERQLKKARLKRQTRLTDASYGGRRTKQSRTVSVPRLSILDAPDVSSRPRKEQPQFLKIAARGARSRRDGGRQSPTGKFVKLGSKLDTADATESLRDWRRGAIQQTNISRPQSKPRMRHTLANLSTAGRRAAPTDRNTRIPNHFAATEPIVVPDDDRQSAQEHVSAGDVAALATPTALPDRSADAQRSTHPERRGNQWIVPRNVAISSLQRNNLRAAATSLAGPSATQTANRAMFGRTLTLLNRDYRQEHSSRAFKPSLPLNRYISDIGSGGSSVAAFSKTSAAVAADSGNRASNLQPRQNRRHVKKNPPNRINLDLDDFVQDQEPVAAVSDDMDSPAFTHAGPTRPSSFSAGGLYNWQRSYSVDFGIAPLRDGTFFHESTFIGSGQFSRSLHVSKRDLDQQAGYSSIPVRDWTLQWGAWNETVSSELGSAFDMIIDDVEKSAVTPPETNSESTLTSASLVYRSLINYVTENLTFIDSVDRTSFVSRAMMLIFKLMDPMAAFITSNEYNKNGLVRFTYYNLVFANQIRQVASHHLVNPALANDALNLVKTSAKDTLTLILSEAGMVELQRLFEESKRPERREKGLREEFPSAEAYIVAQQLLRSSEVFDGILFDLQIDTCTKGIIRNQKDVHCLETAWRGLLTPLPLSEIDHYGIARRELRFKITQDNWALVKKFLSPALDHYETNSANQPISYNAYCRALFQRCHRLINLWGWRDCKPVLDTLYDFFAQKTLYNLKLEESRGSPAFLDELDQNPSLDVRVGEPCFHTLLKIIASGLRFLSERYDNKKIRNFAWRLLPNHGRVYPKEKPLRHEDLDALRNHHDLLCTLYWAVPDGCRPRLETIRNLVHPASSHRETCSINIRSWTRLVRFKLSTKEHVSGLDPFADWHSYFMTELRQQHSHARKEIEAQSEGDEWVSQQLIESTISQNQRQIESLLSMALAGMQTAVELAPSLEHAYRLISRTPFESVLGLFNPKNTRVNGVVSEALQVIMAYTRKDNLAPAPAPTAAAPAVVASGDDDSQEFGDCDWTDIDAVLVQHNPPSEGIEHVQRALHPMVSRLVSNCFGADHCPEDAILVKAVDCWTSIARVLVRHGLKHWDNYLSQFGDESWARLRDTMQTRKFAPQFLAVCIEKDAQVLSDCRILVMGMWISSLAERSSMLKFQHRLTEALLNGSPQDPLLQNLPFTKDKKIGRYSIALEDLSHRRLSLISSLLSNMREHVLRLEVSASRDLNVTKNEYSELLQHLMAAMKDNYHELGNGAVESAQGAYVDFVHRIIRFLQELTSDIRPVDPFFTDPALFPLPSTDPRYIVAKLKRYEPKLSSNKELQTLTVFIQGIAERALVEGQQDHLVDQLHTAMKDTYEAGRPDKPTLRAVLLQCVFPAYLELAFSSPAAWLLSRPIIQSVSLVFKELLFSLDTTDPACVSSLLNIFGSVFQSSYRALRPLSHRPTRLRDSTVLAMLAAFIEMVSSSLVVVDYLDRATDPAEGLISYIQWFRDFAMAATSHVALNAGTGTTTDLATIQPPESLSNTSTTPTPQNLTAARRLAFEDHQTCLRNWSVHEGKYYYTRSGHDSKEITVASEIAAVVENEGVAKKAFEAASRGLMIQVENLGLLPPCEGMGHELRDEGMKDESSLSRIYACLRQ